MRLLTLTATYHPSQNGVAVTIALQKQVMEKSGHTFVVVGPYHARQTPEPDVYRLPSLPNPFAGDYPLIIPFPTPAVLALFSRKFDALIYHHPYVIGWISLLLGRLRRIPTIFVYHTRYDMYIDHYLPRFFPAPLKKIIKGILFSPVTRAVTGSDLVIAETPTLASYLRHLYPQANIRILPSGRKSMVISDVPKARLRHKYSLPQNKIILLCVARLTPEKNLVTLLEYYSRCHPAHRLHLCLAGDGPQKTQLEALATGLGITGRISFLGGIPFSQMPEIYSLADIYIYTSLTETQGATILEAMSAGLPAVALKAPGPQDFITHGQNGYLVSTEKDFITNVGVLASDGRLRRKIGSAAKTSAAGLDLPIWGKAWEKILIQLKSS